VISESVGSLAARVKSLKTKVNVGTLNETHGVKGSLALEDGLCATRPLR
jgi:hypothetical protein